MLEEVAGFLSASRSLAKQGFFMLFISQIHPSGGGETINLRPPAPPPRFSDPDLADLNRLASGPCAHF